MDTRTEYGLACITNVYNRGLTRCYMKIDGRAAALPLIVRSISSRKQSEETKLKISKANKGKRLGCDPWNKGKVSGNNKEVIRKK